MEIFDIGDEVRIVLEPGCPQEWRLHIIYPTSRGLTGYIEGAKIPGEPRVIIKRKVKEVLHQHTT